MIIGKDKERVRKLEIEAELSRGLIEKLKNDLEEIGDALKNEDLQKAIDYPYMNIFGDIGRCRGHLDFFK